nr:hypothetical protein [Salinivirgaceae bacterium]
MEKLNENQKKVIAKLKSEIQKDIKIAVEMAKYGGLFDLLYFLYTLKINRLELVYKQKKQSSTSLHKIATNLFEETTKYIIQLLLKYSKQNIVKNKKTGMPSVNFKLAESLINQCNLINSKYESIFLMQLFDVEILDENIKNVKINVHEATTNKNKNKFL